MRKIIALVLSMILMMAIPAIALARASDHIETNKVVAKALKDGRISATATIETRDSATSLGFPTIYIQEYNGGWTTVKTVNDKYGSGLKHTKTIYYDGVAGREYRAKASYKAVVNGTTEQKPLSTSTTVVGK